MEIIVQASVALYVQGDRIMDTYYIPLLSYTWADDHGCNWTDQRERLKENRTRLCTVAKFTTPDDEMFSIEARVIIEPFPDFCGGLLVRSPQVLVHSAFADPWGGQRQFTYPGSEGDIGLSFLWSAISQNPNRILDLAEVTGKERWTRQEATEYMWECVARSVVSDLLVKGKRGFVGADHTHGNMTQLVDAIGALNGEAIPTSAPARYSRINDVTGTPSWVPSCESEVRTTVIRVDVQEQISWRNVNSGNNVHWLPVSIETEQDGFEEDGYYDDHDEWVDVSSNIPKYGTLRVHEGVQRVYSTRNFVRGVPRTFWRNG